jgi:glycosyltransferase involved in cell wall biosynthesis
VIQNPPFFSIIIPTYKRPQRLAVCLQALTRLNYPRDRFEVIVVDDGSGSPPADLVDSYGDRLDIKLLTPPHAGPAAARNAGAAEARGSFLAFTDDDCAPDPDWLQALAAHFAATPDHLVGGRTLNALADNPFSTTSQLLISYLYSYYNSDPTSARFFASNNLAVAAAPFHAIGGFDTTYTLAASEDRELCDRWLYHGQRMSYAPAAVVYHAHALTLGGYWRQHFNYGCGAAQFHAARAQRSQQGIKLEPPSFYINLLCYPFTQRSGWWAPLQSLLLLTSQVASALGYFWERASRQRS